MKKINLRGISEILSEKELKNVMGGDYTLSELVVTPCNNPDFPCAQRGDRCSYVSKYDYYLWTGTCKGNGDQINAVMHLDNLKPDQLVCHGAQRLMYCGNNTNSNQSSNNNTNEVR
jgi:natural product precursor